MNNNFPKLAMARFSEQFKGQNLTSMHATNPQPFTQVELEQLIDQSFNQIIDGVSLGFSADEGSVALRQTLVNQLYDGINTDYVIAHAGAQEALFCAFYAVLKAGDRVLSVAPVFEPLVQIPYNMGCVVSYVFLDSDNWSLDLNKIESEFKLGCQLFIINFPHNPTGATVTKMELMAITDLCRKYGVWLLSDEVFTGLEHEPGLRLPAVANLYEKGISIGVISKAYAIPGLRIGWMVCQNQKLRDKVIDIKGYLSICNSQIDELLVSVILKSDKKILNRNLSIINKNKLILKQLKSVLNHPIKLWIPNTGCSAFAEIKSDIKSNELVNIVANKHHYLLYPSTLFKTQLNGFRMGYGSHAFDHFVSSVGGY